MESLSGSLARFPNEAAVSGGARAHLCPRAPPDSARFPQRSTVSIRATALTKRWDVLGSWILMFRLLLPAFQKSLIRLPNGTLDQF